MCKVSQINGYNIIIAIDNHSDGKTNGMLEYFVNSEEQRDLDDAAKEFNMESILNNTTIGGYNFRQYSV